MQYGGQLAGSQIGKIVNALVPGVGIIDQLMGMGLSYGEAKELSPMMQQGLSYEEAMKLKNLEPGTSMDISTLLSHIPLGG